jgi:predicted glycosyltransferase
MFEISDGIDFLKLPSLVMVDRYRNWQPRDLSLPTATVTAMRSDLLRDAVRHFAPDLLVADFMPAGPYGELLPALEELERVGGRAVAGFRDVVEEPEFVRTLWEETGVYGVLRSRYAAVCVYGDPAMIDFAAYGLGEAGGPPLHYCGYLGREPVPVEAGSEAPLVVATSGGGVDGADVLAAFLEAAGELRRELAGDWLAVTGPLMPLADHGRLAERGAAAGVRVERSLPTLRSLVARAHCVVAMAGYNTACDILSYRRRAVLVPRPGPSLEQSLRAHRLGQWGVARVVRAGELDPARLAGEMAAALETPGIPPAAPIPLAGVERALDVFDLVLEKAKAA